MAELDRPSAEDLLGQTLYLLAGVYTILVYLVEDTLILEIGFTNTLLHSLSRPHR